MLCCNSPQLESIITVSATVVVSMLLWSSVAFAPLKLVSVFLHEASHALATVATGGKVREIEINEFFGGHVVRVGGMDAPIIMAGYIGSVLWGCYFLISTVNRTATYVATSFYIVACIGGVCVLKIHQKRCCGCKFGYKIVLQTSMLVMAGIPIAFWVLEEHVDMPWLGGVSPLRICLLVIGSVCVMTATYDCVHDVLFKKYDDPNNKSDAVSFRDRFGGSARCWGLIWSLISVAALAGSLFLLVWLDRTR